MATKLASAALRAPLWSALGRFGAKRRSHTAELAAVTGGSSGGSDSVFGRRWAALAAGACVVGAASASVGDIGAVMIA